MKKLFVVVASMVMLALSAASALGYHGGDHDCADFGSQEDAQTYFRARGGSPTNNVDNLDRDNDGVACEDHSPYASAERDEVPATGVVAPTLAPAAPTAAPTAAPAGPTAPLLSNTATAQPSVELPLVIGIVALLVAAALVRRPRTTR